jgi:hypothetical protein
MSGIRVIGTVFKKRGEEGDFDWMIRSGKYNDALFIYNDDEMRQHWKKAGTGNAVIRKYNRYALDRPFSAGVVTGPSSSGYSKLTVEVRQRIDGCFSVIRELCKKHGYKTIYYSASTLNGLLGTSIFVVGEDVLQYITDNLHGLAN